MMTLENIIGMPLDNAVRALNGYSVKITDISSPDKYHAHISPRLRVVKALASDNDVLLIVAGFKDSV